MFCARLTASRRRRCDEDAVAFGLPLNKELFRISDLDLNRQQDALREPLSLDIGIGRAWSGSVVALAFSCVGDRPAFEQDAVAIR